MHVVSDIIVTEEESPEFQFMASEAKKPQVYCHGWTAEKLSEVLKATEQKPANILGAYYNTNCAEQLVLSLRVEGAFTKECAIVPRLEFLCAANRRAVTKEQKGTFVTVAGLEGAVTTHFVVHGSRSINSIYGISFPKEEVKA